jgi:hypothetical protein
MQHAFPLFTVYSTVYFLEINPLENHCKYWPVAIKPLGKRWLLGSGAE